MAYCYITGGTVTACDYGLGGITDLWIGNKETITGLTATAISVSGSAKMYKCQFEPNTGFYTVELVPGVIKHVNQQIGFQVWSEGQSTNDLASALDLGRFVAIAKSRSTGKKFIFGRTGSGLQAATVTTNSGTQDSDQNLGLIVTLSCASTERPLEYTGSDSSIPV